MNIIQTELIDRDLDYFAIKALSKSFLAQFAISPAHAYVNIETKAMTQGTMFHEIALERKKFAKKYIVTELNLATKEGKKIKAQAKEDSKKIIKLKDYEALELMNKNLYQTPFQFPDGEEKMFGELIQHGKKEQGYIATVQSDEMEYKLKIKTDLTYKHDDIFYCFDLKTVNSANLSKFRWEAKDYRYNWQAMLYSEVLAAHTGMDVRFIFVLCEKTEPFGIRLVELINNDFRPIEQTISNYFIWEAAGGNRKECYNPELNQMQL